MLTGALDLEDIRGRNDLKLRKGFSIATNTYGYIMCVARYSKIADNTNRVY